MSETRDQHNERGREYYQKNSRVICDRTNAYSALPESREKRRESDRKRCAERKQIVDEYKASHGCCKCGESDPACLDLHHIDYFAKEYHGKRSCVSQRLRKLSVERLMREVEKCVVLCSNCHRKHHASVGWEWLGER